MNIDYSLLLFVLVLTTGLVWLADAMIFGRARRQSLQAFLKANDIQQDALFDYRKKLHKGDAPAVSQKLKKQFSQALEINRESTLVEYCKSFFPILFAVLFFRSFLFEPFQIPTGSMIPSLNVGDYIVVNKYSYGIRLPVVGTKVVNIGDPQRGDVMVFIPPHDPVYYVKRVIGVPGDFVRYSYEDKKLYINGEEQLQDFVGPDNSSGRAVNHFMEQLGDVEHDIYVSPGPSNFRYDYWMQPEGMMIPEGYYFMMGDNRDNSDDSRRWGLVPEENIVGKAVAVWMHKEPGFRLPTFGQNRLINP
jgi:signal peptidase I